MYTCKFCSTQCRNKNHKIAHQRYCELNPNVEQNHQQHKLTSNTKKAHQKSYEKYLNDPLNQIQTYTFTCQKCGKEYTLDLRVRDYNKGKYSKFCSTQCAHSRTFSPEVKAKQAEALRKNHITLDQLKAKYYENPKYCVVCGKIIEYEHRNRKTCSDECKKICFRQAGLHSVQVMQKRSKNEILFANKCIQFFKDENITTNEQFFNGWDADVIFHNKHIAVLWNGTWHYKQIMKKKSLKQIQNRDQIKLKEIQNKGYIPYIIQDMGHYSEKKVNQQFQKFKTYYLSL